MSLVVLRCLLLQQARTLYKIPFRSCSSKSDQTRNRLEQKPKQPASIFGLFLEDHIEEHLANNPYSKRNELIRLVGEAWKEAPEDQRKNYREKYLELTQKYKQQLVEFEDRLSDDQRVIQVLKDKREQATASQDIPMHVEFPRRPSTAFSHFIKFARNAFPMDPNQSVAKWNEQMAEKWRSMNEEDKQSFREASKKSYKTFEVDKDDWQSTFSVDEVGGFQR